MPKKDKALEALRGQIDRIDDGLHDMLMRRAEIVAEIADAKKGTSDLVMRPGREAMILRRVLDRHRGALPRAVVARIWREMITAMVRLQGPLHVAVCAPEMSVGYWDLASAHYGTTTPMTLHRSPSTVLRMVTERPGVIGVLPVPQDDDEDPWWPGLASGSEQAPRVITRLPFTELGEARFESLSALAVATCEVERTGDDVTLLIVAGNNQVSRGRLKDQFEKVDLEVRFTAAIERHGDQPEYQHLVEVPDYVGQNDPRLEALLEVAEEDIGVVFRVGGYPVPFRI